jgi:hypothetical protein
MNLPNGNFIVIGGHVRLGDEEDMIPFEVFDYSDKKWHTKKSHLSGCCRSPYLIQISPHLIFIIEGYRKRSIYPEVSLTYKKCWYYNWIIDDLFEAPSLPHTLNVITSVSYKSWL